MIRRLAQTAALLAATALAAAAQPASSTPPPELAAELVAGRTAIAPGESIDLAIVLDVTAPWHIYHPIVLDTGLATRIEFEAAPGLTVENVRFPAPALGELGGLEYLELSGRIVALATLRAADSLEAPQTARLSAKISALACIEQCVPVSAAAELSLPIGPDGQAANQDLIAKAREALPPELSKAEYLEGGTIRVVRAADRAGGAEGSASPAAGGDNPKTSGEAAALGLNEPGELVATIRVKAGHHVQHRDPGVEDLIPTRLFVEQVDGIESAAEDKQTWSDPHVRDMPGFGRVREQSGEFTIRVPFRITDPDLSAGPHDVRVLLRYQACTDAGQCYAPAWASGTGTVVFDPARTNVAAAGMAENTGAASGGEAGLTAGAGSGTGADSGAGAGAFGDAERSLWQLLGLAFLGGIILNIMPCVLPVISLKILGFARQAGDQRGRIFRMGLVYTLGILASFLPLAILMASAGAAWGSLMQRPAFLIVLASVVFVFGLSLVGVFEFRLPGVAMSVAGDAAHREGYGGAFLSGVMTTALATPCTAPVLGPALGTFTLFPPVAQFAGIMAIGAGLAAPYLLLSAVPGWLRFLPKPGKWMITFKQVVGFVVFVVVVWLLSILSSQVDMPVFLGTLALLVAVAFACWMLGSLTPNSSTPRTLATWATAVLVVAGGGYGGFKVFDPGWQQIPWQDWQAGLPESLAGEGYTVYVDYTADWCVTCQTNKRFVLETDEVRAKLADLDVVPIKADFTREDPQILADLRKYERNGVPLNVVLPAGAPDRAIVLPELLTESAVLEALEQAGASRQKPVLARK